MRRRKRFSRATHLQTRRTLIRRITAYTEAIRLNPKLADAYCFRGGAYFQKKDCTKAIADFTEAIRLNPKHAGAFTGRGAAYYTEGDMDKAIADCTEAIHLDPNLTVPYCRRAGCLSKEGRSRQGNCRLERGDPSESASRRAILHLLRSGLYLRHERRR